VHARVPTAAELADFYARHYRQDYHGETTPSARRVVRAWRNGERIYRQLAHYVKPGDRVFEVGAGIGCNVKVFQQQGCLASGIEPGEGFWQFSREKLRASIARCDLMQIAAEPRYELVLLVHVIEHLASPTESLTRIRKLLHPGGRLYVECPNLAAPFAVRSRLFHFAHIHNFTPRTLTMLAEECGFEVEARFGAADDPNLQMLLRRAGAGRLRIDPQSYPETLERLSRYNALTYHLRWNYLWPRCRKVLTYLDEQVLAGRRLRRILKRCAETEPTGDPCSQKQAA
jgi:2-polyprenyl-3-methyl-5-hydroxy-6-metoxy-1,4-benzoquinol methylase